MVKYYDINAAGHSIRCKLYCTDFRDISRVVITGHGFGGHKDNRAMERFADNVLSKYKRTAVLAFDWPCHGADVKKKLTLTDCSTYIDLVIADCRERLGAEERYVYATSFGAYLFLKYIMENGNPFRKIALRCPSVKMYETMTRRVMAEGDEERLAKGKEIAVGFDRKIKIGAAFLEELRENDISALDFLDYAEDILILHGTKDEVVPFDEVYSFADNNLIEFIPIENADHRFQNLTQMDLAIKYILQFFF